MQRRVAILAATATVVVAAAGPARVAAAARGASDRATSGASVALLSCSSGITSDERAAVYEGRMSRAPGTRRMQMLFLLQSRHGAAQRWSGVPGPGLGAWLSSAPGVARYTFTKRIENLTAPATYRVVVRFRWLDARGRVLRTDRATSKACAQPDLRPQLVPRGIDVVRVADPNRRRYVVTVRNRGRTAAGAFDVAFDAPARLPLGRVVDLGPGATTLVSFEAPRCQPGSTLTATVDPIGLVEEADEDDNTLAVPCPPGAG